MRQYLPVFGHKYQQIVTTVAAKTVVQAIQTLVRSLNASDNLQTLGGQKKDYEKLAEICVLDGSTPRNPLPITAKDFLDIYERMYQAEANSIDQNLSVQLIRKTARKQKCD